VDKDILRLGSSLKFMVLEIGLRSVHVVKKERETEWDIRPKLDIYYSAQKLLDCV
jgi:hypothetical protein